VALKYLEAKKDGKKKQKKKIGPTLTKYPMYPQAPPLISKFVDSLLRESSAALSVSKSFLDTSNLTEATSYLETVHGSLLHLGRLADVQTIRHGIPPVSTDNREDCGLSPRDELLQTFAQSLMAHYLRPPTADTPPFHPGGGGGGGGGVPSAPPTAPSGEGSGSGSSASASSSSSAAAAGAGELEGLEGGAVGLPPLPSAPSQEKPQVERKGKWTLDEDARLMEGVKLYTEKKPSQIAAFVGTRSSGQVRDRLKQLRKIDSREVVSHSLPLPPPSVAAPSADAAISTAAAAAAAATIADPETPAEA